MSEKTAISWTDATFNPWWGCVKVSPGCEHCYAESTSKRYGHDVWGPKAERRFFSKKHWDGPLKWNKAAGKLGRQLRVFTGSMCDIAEDRPDLVAPRDRLMQLIEVTPYLTWLLLTKRPENFDRLFTKARWINAWPTNVIAMTTAENQDMFNVRIDHLVRTPANRIAISAEPLLGPIEINKVKRIRKIDQVIVGGESGPGARPLNLDWAAWIKEDCRSAGTAFFMKQLGGFPSKRDKLSDFPPSLRIQEFAK